MVVQNPKNIYVIYIFLKEDIKQLVLSFDAKHSRLSSPTPQLVIRVHMSDESSKTMMVDERQTVRQVLDSLLDKSHCGYSPDWSLVETINELQMGKGADVETPKSNKNCLFCSINTTGDELIMSY